MLRWTRRWTRRVEDKSWRVREEICGCWESSFLAKVRRAMTCASMDVEVVDSMVVRCVGQLLGKLIHKILRAGLLRSLVVVQSFII